MENYYYYILAIGMCRAFLFLRASDEDGINPLSQTCLIASMASMVATGALLVTALFYTTWWHVVLIATALYALSPIWALVLSCVAKSNNKLVHIIDVAALIGLGVFTYMGFVDMFK